MFDYIIVGAGFAGSVMAERLASQLGKKILVIDKRSHIGGNCFDEEKSDILIHKYGPHLFHTNNSEVYNYLGNFTEWDVYNHKVRAYINGQDVPLPFNFNTINQLFPTQLADKFISKLIETYTYDSKVPILELMKSDDVDLKFLAQFIYDNVFVNYTAKQWGLKPEELDSAVTSRVPIYIGMDDRYFNDKYQAIPKDGYTNIFNRMLHHENITVMLNTDFKDICEVVDDKILYDGKPFAGELIYTGQIDELFDYKLGELPYRSVYMDFRTVNYDFYQNAATVNYPNNYDFTRITEFKHIHNSQSKQTVILKEFPQDYIKGKNTPYYPIFTEENSMLYNNYLKLSLNITNLTLLGRLAEYKYYDMDDIVERALEVFNERFNNVK